jgi:hypothetical protein
MFRALTIAVSLVWVALLGAAQAVAQSAADGYRNASAFLSGGSRQCLSMPT